MITKIDAKSLKAWLSDGREIALLDVREHGQYGAGHPFSAVSLPFSRLEIGLARLVPNPRVRLVLYDDADGVASRAAVHAQSLGYTNVFILEGGAPAWRNAGYTLFAGVNVPSKTFGELVEHVHNTPRVTAEQLEGMRQAGEDLAIIDGRTFAEYRRMNIPGGVCCPNGELALRIGNLVPSPQTKIVVNCAGRTRSIIGAQTLIDLGLPNPVFALENGTQGWFLAGLELEHSAERRYRDVSPTGGGDQAKARARQLAEARGATFVTSAEVSAWLADPARSTYVFDIRTEEEFVATGASACVHAPGGQLIQATDLWVGVKGARILVVDAEEIRAPVVAAWLRQLGHEAHVLAGGIAAARSLTPLPRARLEFPALSPISVGELADGLRSTQIQLIDLRPSMTFRAAHIADARWSIRPRLASALDGSGRPIVLIADDAELAALAARDLAQEGVSNVRLLAGGVDAWRSAGLPLVATPGEPPDAECIDFLFFTAARHDGDAEAARQYLTWEIGLVDQLDEQERGAFRITAPA